MPSRSQITRHDCVEGWSCIAKWTGTQLGPLLDMARVKSGARFCVYHCFDNIQRTLSGDILYYESSDLVDAYHPQTLLSYGLNDKVLPVSNGAPVRLRIERAGPETAAVVNVYVDGTPILVSAPMSSFGKTMSDVNLGFFVEGESGRRVRLTVDDVEIVRRRG